MGGLFRFALVIVILVSSGAVAYHWMSNPPTTERRPPAPRAHLVEVIPVRVGPERVVVRAMGTVTPSKRIQIAAQVSGKIVDVSLNFERGGRFAAGEEILQIERADYELAVKQQEANLTKAEADVQLEMGQQAVARREYELLGEAAAEEEVPLLLREPQLAAKEAAVAVARAALERARLDLERTTVYAPFHAIVLERPVNLGSHVAPSTPLATLASADACWVETSLPVDELQWIDVPHINGTGGAAVRIYQEAAWGAEAFREGAVERLLGDLEPKGRMARLLVRVDDPLDLGTSDAARHSLLLGSFVRVEIEARELAGVARVPRSALHDGAAVWIMAPDSTLDIRPVNIAWSGRDDVLVIDDLADGELLITSTLATPVLGMALRTAEGPS